MSQQKFKLIEDLYLKFFFEKIKNFNIFIFYYLLKIKNLSK